METDFLFQVIQDRLDPDEIVDILGIGSGELALRLRKQILENRERFESHLEIYED